MFLANVVSQGGTISVWDVDRKVSDDAEDSEVFGFDIHSRPVSALVVNRNDHTKACVQPRKAWMTCATAEVPP
jgi:hypothetical protein